MGRALSRALTDANTWIALRVFVARSVLAMVLGLTFWALVPAALGWNVSVITSGSMMPAIRPGQIVAGSPIDFADVRPGQIITVANPASNDGSLLTHRVIRIDSEGRLILRGDANNVADSTPVPPSDTYLGRLVIPIAGMPRLWAAQGNMLALVATGLGLGLLVVASFDRPLLRPRRPEPGEATTRKPGRIVVETAAVALVVALVLVPVRTSMAAFTARTSLPVSSWAVGGVPGVTIGAYGDAVLANSPFIFYRLEEASGTHVEDSSGQGNHGHFIGTPDRTQTGSLPGQLQPNLATAFNGTSAIVSDHQTVAVDNFTFSAFLQSRDWQDNQGTGTIFQFRTPTGFSHRIFVEWGSLYYQADETQGRIPLQRGLTATGQWHHLALTVDGGQVTIHFGGFEWSTTVDFDPAPGYANVLIGTNQSPDHAVTELGTDNYRGLMDDIALFDRALSSAEIASMWQASGLAP